MNKVNFAYFGTDEFSICVLDELRSNNFIPSLIVTAPDRPAGRGQKIQKPPLKVWAEERNIPVVQPEKLNRDFIKDLSKEKWDLFIVASYGKIIPKEIIELPERKTLNVHPSLLPLYRGTSPIESVMLDDAKETGVSIMMIDEKMDHGPILEQEEYYFEEWPKKKKVEEKLARLGGEILSKIIPDWISGNLNIQEQDHDKATFTKKITKEMGLIDLNDDPRKNFLKIQALNPWPGTYFFIKHHDKEIGVKFTEAKFKDEELIIEKVIPESKKEMSWEDFERGYVK